MGLRPTEGDEDLRKNHFTYDRVADVAQALSRGALSVSYTHLTLPTTPYV